MSSSSIACAWRQIFCVYAQLRAALSAKRLRVTEAASKITSITRSGAEYIGLWSTRPERTFAPIRPAINRCVLGLIVRSSSPSKNQDGFDFHPGAGALS